jgi:hypothetical protein
MDTRIQMRHMDRIINIVEMMRLWSETQPPRPDAPADQPNRDYWLEVPTPALLTGPLAGIEECKGPGGVRVNVAKLLCSRPAVFEAWKRLTASTEYPWEAAISHITSMSQIYGGNMITVLDEAGHLVLTELFPKWIEANLPEDTYKASIRQANAKNVLKPKLVTDWLKGFFFIAYPLYKLKLQELEQWDRDLPEEAAQAKMRNKPTVIARLKK